VHSDPGIIEGHDEPVPGVVDLNALVAGEHPTKRLVVPADDVAPGITGGLRFDQVPILLELATDAG
jgi:hypothetical protein